MLEQIEYLTEPETVISQYGRDVTIEEIRDHLQIAFRQLKLYRNLVESAVSISQEQYFKAFLQGTYDTAKG